MNFIKNHFPVIIMIIIEIAFGILLLIDPDGFTRTLIKIFGIILMVIGIIYVIRYLSDKHNNYDPSVFTIVFAILSVIIGAICTFLTSWVISWFAVLAVIYGIFLIISAVFKIESYSSLRHMDVPATPFLIVSAIISIILGVIIIIHPFEAVTVVWVFTGISLIAEAILDIIALILAAKKSA